MYPCIRDCHPPPATCLPAACLPPPDVYTAIVSRKIIDCKVVDEIAVVIFQLAMNSGRTQVCFSFCKFQVVRFNDRSSPKGREIKKVLGHHCIGNVLSSMIIVSQHCVSVKIAGSCMVAFNVVSIALNH